MELAGIFEPVSRDMKSVERELKLISDEMSRTAGPGRRTGGILGRIVQHPFAIAGKRIRPALVLLSSGSVGALEGSPSLIRLAVAVEMLHAASLVHDDIIDSADTRRHQISLNKRFGNKIAVLAGDILYTHFFTIITGLSDVPLEKRLAVLDVFLQTTKTMCMGEILAQETDGSPRLPMEIEEYLEITTDKTAALFSACCRTAGIVSGADEKTIAALADFGLSFGLTFQMVDDLLDRDYRLDPRVDLPAQAKDYAEKAKARTEALPPSVYRERLRDLTDFVIGQAFP
jgi:octaprenyl-diphosphate synthase